MNATTKLITTKKIILCADDYAQSAAVSAGILQLVEQWRLSAVSCFSEAEFWSSAENTLFDYRDRIDIGLHFNLTHPLANTAVTAKALGNVMGLSLSGRLEHAQIQKALHAQLDRFEAVAQQMPDFVDGHQHVHVLPGIRDVVIRELARRYGAQKPYLRAVNPRLPGNGGLVKLAVLKLLGSGFSNAAGKNGLRTNTGFAGIYALQPHIDFAALMNRWLAAARNGDLLMCHPGVAANDISDPIAATRPKELSFLLSAEFGALLSYHSAQLSRFCDIQR